MSKYYQGPFKVGMQILWRVAINPKEVGFIEAEVVAVESSWLIKLADQGFKGGTWYHTDDIVILKLEEDKKDG